MKPEWVTAGAAVFVALGSGINLFVSLRTRVLLLKMEQGILDRVELVYKRRDVCEVEMDALRGGCR